MPEMRSGPVLGAADVVCSTGLQCQTLRVQPHPNLPASKSECADELICQQRPWLQCPGLCPVRGDERGHNGFEREELRGIRMRLTTLLARRGYRGCVNAPWRNSWQEVLTLRARHGARTNLRE